jgi:hypothetical protein
MILELLTGKNGEENEILYLTKTFSNWRINSQRKDRNSTRRCRRGGSMNCLDHGTTRGRKIKRKKLKTNNLAVNAMAA